MRAEGWRKVASATWRGPLDPQIYGDLEIDAEELLAFIEEVRAATGVRVTVTHLVGRAIARALGENPELNVRKRGGRFEAREDVAVFFVVAVDGGRDLSGVKVRDADRKSAVEIARELSERAVRIRSAEDADFGRSKKLLARTPTLILRPSLRLVTWLTSDVGLDLRRFGLRSHPFGSALVTSVGMLGVQHAYAPLSPFYRVPFLALVSEITEKPVVRDGEIVARPLLTISATMDHRYLDGAHAASLARSVRAYLEDPRAHEPPVPPVPVEAEASSDA
ncbi:MAG TPA: 2-oxo acid dehydrogenase subunit E2 [Gaiellaceae bacterium]|nr:2-oxo acid dehydrogenase subunit E2 [Gaiellaceae bacterium]